VATQPQAPQEVRVVSHSNLYYWWPVWACGFILGIIGMFEGHMVVLPHSWHKEDVLEKVEWKTKNARGEDEWVNRAALILPAKTSIDDLGKPLHASRSKIPGIVFCTILLLVLVFTNVPLRGMWSYLVIVSVVLIALILHLLQWWDPILGITRQLDIRINAGGYIFFSSVLCLIWILTIMVFDRRMYIVFGPRILRVCVSIGEGEKQYDAIGLVLEKQQSDLFRHKILGLGAGDLVVRTSGAQAHHFDLPNVLFIDHKLRQIERLISTQRQESGGLRGV